MQRRARFRLIAGLVAAAWLDVARAGADYTRGRCIAHVSALAFTP